MNSQGIVSIIRRIDETYQNSPTAQFLTSQAPMILSSFREMRMQINQQRMELERIHAQRSKELERFREIAPTLNKEISLIGQEIRNLQKTVRDTAADIGRNPNAQTVIDYTNKQISDLIQMFNSLAISLINA